MQNLMKLVEVLFGNEIHCVLMIVQRSKGDRTSLLSLKYSFCVEFVPWPTYHGCAKNIVRTKKGLSQLG